MAQDNTLNPQINFYDYIPQEIIQIILEELKSHDLEQLCYVNKAFGLIANQVANMMLKKKQAPLECYNNKSPVFRLKKIEAIFTDEFTQIFGGLKNFYELPILNMDKWIKKFPQLNKEFYLPPDIMRGFKKMRGEFQGAPFFIFCMKTAYESYSTGMLRYHARFKENPQWYFYQCSGWLKKNLVLPGEHYLFDDEMYQDLKTLLVHEKGRDLGLFFSKMQYAKTSVTLTSQLDRPKLTFQ